MALPFETDTTVRLYDPTINSWQDYPKEGLGAYQNYPLMYPNESYGAAGYFNFAPYTAAAPSSGGEEEGGEEGGGFNLASIPTNLFQKSKTGLPEWGEAWAKDWLGQYSGQIGKGLSESLTKMEDPVALNEAQKQQLQYYTNENLRPIVSNLGYRGVLNSTTSQNAISRLLSEMGAKSYEQAWKQQQEKVAAYQKSQALLTAILEATRMGESSNPFQPWEAMLPYLLGNVTG